MTTVIETLRAELERLFELDELLELSRDLLGLDPNEVGGKDAIASYVQALTRHCSQTDAIEALVDAVIATKQDVKPEVHRIRHEGLAEDEDAPLPDGAPFGEFAVLHQLGATGTAIAYLARYRSRDVRLSVLRMEAVRDRRSLNRFKTFLRLLGRVDYPGIPAALSFTEVEGRTVVFHEYLAGVPLQNRITRTGPLHINEAQPVLRAILEPLAELHERRLVHGGLCLDNIIVARDSEGQQSIQLLDAGFDRLGRVGRATPPDPESLPHFWGSPKASSPEQLRGTLPTPQSDVYAFGALLYELLTGSPVFPRRSPVEMGIGHLHEPPVPPSTIAPRGWVPRDLDALVLRLLHKDPVQRPRNATEVLGLIDELESSITQVEQTISDEEVDELVDDLVAEPHNQEAATALEAAVDRGADTSRIGRAFEIAAEALDASVPDALAVKVRLLAQAAKLFAADQKLEKAEAITLSLLEVDPKNEEATLALFGLRRRLRKYEDLVEMLLKRSEEAKDRAERARAFTEIGDLYARELNDPEQALVAYSQAFAEDPSKEACANEIGKLAGTKQENWEEVLSTCVAAVSSEGLTPEHKSLLLLQMGDWYFQQVQRSDLALPVYQAVLESDPTNDRALGGLGKIYRKAQQWPELGLVLTTRADATLDPALARDLRAEAAEILEIQLGDAGGARELYTQIIAADPGHVQATEALARLYERALDFENLAKLLERRLGTEQGEQRLKTLSRIAELYEDKLDDPAESIARYRQVLELDPLHLPALLSLDRLYSKTSRFTDLLANLQQQLGLAATPRQRIILWQRIAGIYDEEFLDHEHAVEAWEEVLRIDSAYENALGALPRHYRALGRWDALQGLYERHANVTESDERRLDLLLARGRTLAEHLANPEEAMSVYEQAIAIDPQHAGALEALARLREAAGDAEAALVVIDALADKATSAEAKHEQYLRAAKLLESRGDRDGSIEYYKRALDQVPSDTHASAALRAAYVARGDINAAISLLEKEYDRNEGEATKARLSAEIAVLARERLKDDERAEAAAKRAVKLDPTSIEARTVLGDLAFEAQRYLEASKHYEVIADRADTLSTELSVRVLVRYVDALSRSGAMDKALAPMDTLLRLAPDDTEALERVAQMTFEHGPVQRAVELYEGLFRRFGPDLRAKGESLYRFGESLRRVGRGSDAIAYLEEAADLDPSDAKPLAALAHVFEDKQDWEQVVRAKTRHLDIATGEERVQLLIEIGEIADTKLRDRPRATKSYVAALDERPDDRKLLTRLMQLYSEEQEWDQLVEVVIRLASFVDDVRQKAKYLQTAAIVTARQLNDSHRALEYYREVMALDPGNERALEEALELERGNGSYEQVEELLRRKLTLATDAQDRGKMLAVFIELGELYERDLAWIDKAIDAYEAAQTLDPSNTDRVLKLTDLYATDPDKYLEKAVASQLSILQENPYRPESYKLLRRLYTETKHADAAWCLCQALYVLSLAEADEERFFKRMKSETAAPAREVLTDEDWLTLLMHPDADALLTSVFALIEPAVIGKRSQSLEQLGYDPQYLIDLTQNPYPMSQNLYYAAGVLGIEAPPAFQNPNDPAGLSFLHAYTPSIVLGQAAMQAEIPAQAAAFIAARHLAYFRPGMYVRQLVPTGTGLKAWLFAAIKLISPQFRVAPELEGPMNDALAALEAGVTGQARDQLARVVSRLLQGGGSLDLKRWVAGVDLTADRVGFVIAHDLETAVEIIKASDEATSAVARDLRLKELVLYSISKPFFDLRGKLGISIDA